MKQRESLEMIASGKNIPNIFSEEHLQRLADSDLEESAIPYLEKACFSPSLLIRESSPLLLYKVYQSTKAYDALKALVGAVASPSADIKALQALVSISDARCLKLLRAIKSKDGSLKDRNIDETIQLIEAKNSGVETLADQRVDSDEGIERMLKYLADTPSDWGKGQSFLTGALGRYPTILFRFLTENPGKFFELAEHLVKTHDVYIQGFWVKKETVGALFDCYQSDHPEASRLAEEVFITMTKNSFRRPSNPQTREKWLRWAEDPHSYEE